MKNPINASSARREMQVTGKHLNGAKARKFFTCLADAISPTDEVVGSLDLNDYGFQTTFAVNGAVIAVSILGMEGGEL